LLDMVRATSIPGQSTGQQNFRETQHLFSAYIRNPTDNPPPDDIELRRMEIYKTLFINNMESLVETCFPVLRKLLGDARWHSLIRDFYVDHSCETPYFSEVPEEFLEYLQDERGDVEGDFPFMFELAHYEWVEMALETMDVSFSPVVNQDPTQDVMSEVFTLSPLVWPLHYQYPVHLISESYLPVDAPEEVTYLSVYRDESDLVKFTEINAITFRLMQLLEDNDSFTVEDHLSQISSEMTHVGLDAVMTGGKEIIDDFLSRGWLFRS